MNIFFLVAQLSALAYFVSGELRQVTLYKKINFSGRSKNLKYENDCVNLDEEWKKSVNSVNTYGLCVTLYSQSDCKGNEYVHLFPGSSGSDSLFDVRFDNAVMSFQKCDGERYNALEAPPWHKFYLYFAGNDTTIHKFSHVAGCFGLTDEDREAVKVFVEVCHIIYKHNECKKTASSKYLLPGSPNYNKTLRDIGFNGKLTSFSNCDLYYTSSCQWCSKAIYKGSDEYEFWKYLFTVYSKEFLNAFEDRVQQSPSGMITWDFVNVWPDPKPGIQYADALIMQNRLLRRLHYCRKGYLGFNGENVDQLRKLAKRVLSAKKSKAAVIREDWANHDFVVHQQLIILWKDIVDTLEELCKRWHHPENREDCGLITKDEDKTDTLIKDGVVAVYGEDPWHVAIYRVVRKNSLYELICGGTLISQNVVISAGHCFYNPILGRAANITSEYEVYVGKYTRDYFQSDSDYQVAHKVKSLVFSPKGYNPKATDQYGSDIILIILETSVTLNKHVRVICMDWDKTPIATGTLGKLVGWGETNNQSSGSDVLLRADLPYVSFNDCNGKVKHFTNDKFCGGSLTGQGARKGDSGGGFVFNIEGRYHLRGIVSTRDRDSNSSFSTFTDVSSYLDWISNYI